MPKLTLDDGVELSYRVLGKGPNAVILVHGWMVSGAVFSSLLEVLDLQGLRVIVPDLRGSGASGKPELTEHYALSRYARDVIALAEAESLASYALLGHSMGGQIAQLVAIEDAEHVSGLMLMCSVPAAGAPLPEHVLPGFRAAAHERAARGGIVDQVCKLLTPEDRERLLEDSDKVAPACIAGAFEAWHRGGFQERLAEIQVPTLVIGTDDPTLPPELLRETVVKPISRAHFVHLPGPGHYPQVESPRETAALSQAFLAGLWG
ncbi:MAG: alpha/beta hydrolase [Myxococcales bacterium]